MATIYQVLGICQVHIFLYLTLQWSYDVGPILPSLPSHFSERLNNKPRSVRSNISTQRLFLNGQIGPEWVPTTLLCAWSPTAIHRAGTRTSILSWIEWHLPKKTRYVEVLTPSTSEYTISLRWGLYRGNQIKMRSLGQALMWYDWCPYKKGKFGHRDRYKSKGDNAKGHREKMANYKPRKEALYQSFLSPQKAPNLATPWFQL